jgi:hypothetical protein
MKKLLIIVMLSMLLACAPITPYPAEPQKTEVQVVPPTTEVVKAEIPKEDVVAPIEPKPTIPSAPVVAPVEKNETVESSLSPKEKCTASCETQCEVDAALACKQTERSACRANCGDIITTSACTQACTYVLQQQVQCKSQFEKFCKTQCVSKC